MNFSVQLMNNQSDFRQLFLKAEASTGITKQNFIKKFVYSPTQPSDNFLLDRNTPSPSQLQGFTIQQDKNISYLMSEIIFRAAQSLKIPVSAAIVAVSIAHYFYSRVGALDYDFRDVAMGAMFLACKSEESLRKSYEVFAVFDQVFKIFQGQKMPIKVLSLNSTEYNYMKKKVLDLQNHILFELGFEIYRLFDIPHRYIGGLFKSFQRHPQSKKICQNAWMFLNDFYRTNCCLHYPGQIIAAASIYLSLLKLKIKMPTVAWWILMEANIESIEELIVQLQAFYQSSRSVRYSLQVLAAQINEVGQKQGFTNVFPVNYYRKIDLDIKCQLKIRKPVEMVIQPVANQVVQPRKEVKNQSLEEKEDNQSRESLHKKKKKEKKKEKKDKKKKRDRKQKQKKKYGISSHSERSRSRDRNQQSSQSKSIKMKKVAESRKSPTQNKTQYENRPETHHEIEPKNEKVEQQIIKIEPSEKAEKKEIVRQMQVESVKGFLQKMNTKFTKLSQIKKVQPRRPLPDERQRQSEEEDQELLADLIKIKKNNTEKKGLL